jgi:hypothetical protein
MKTFDIEGVEYTLPEISFKSEDNHPVVFTIEEGEHKGTSFSIVDMRMDDEDETLMWYDIQGTDEETVDKIKPIVDTLILNILRQAAEKARDETSEASNSDT